MEKKILIPLGDAAEAMDTVYPYYRVQEDGYKAVVAGPEAQMRFPVLLGAMAIGSLPRAAAETARAKAL